MAKTLEVFRGDDKTWKVTVTKDSSAQDITGWTIFFTAKKHLTDSDDGAIIKKDITSHTDAANGISAITLSSTDTDVTVGTYVGDIQTVDDQSKVQTVTIINLVVKQDGTVRVS